MDMVAITQPVMSLCISFYFLIIGELYFQSFPSLLGIFARDFIFYSHGVLLFFLKYIFPALVKYD